MAEHCAFLAVFNFRVEFFSFADSVSEVREMKNIIMFAVNLAQQFVVQVVNLAFVARNGQRAFLPVKIDAELRPFKSARIATLAFPGDSLFCEIETRHINIRRLLVIFVMVTVAATSHAAGIIDLQSPASQVERMHTVVAQLAGAPMPE